MRACDIINELEDTELASKIRREYLIQGIDIERECYHLGNVIVGFDWGNGEKEKFWNNEYTKAIKANSKKYTKLSYVEVNENNLIKDEVDEEDQDEDWDEDEAGF